MAGSSILFDLLFERCAATPAHAYRATVRAFAPAHPRVFVARWTHQQHVRDRNGPFLIEDAALHVLRGVRARLPLDDVGMLAGNLALSGVHRKHAAHFAFVPARHHADLIVLTNVQPDTYFWFWLSHFRYQTSGASDTILANCFSRNSRATGPNTRVPTGSFASLISTAALSSNRIYDPSRLRCSLRVRTTTARTTLPFLIWLSGAASFTAAVITSPSPARSPVSPPMGRIIVNWRAPELSATVSHDRMRIIAVVSRSPSRRLYLAPSRCTKTSTSRQRFSFESGRVSMMRTRSPTLACRVSSCA